MNQTRESILLFDILNGLGVVAVYKYKTHAEVSLNGDEITFRISLEVYEYLKDFAKDNKELDIDFFDIDKFMEEAKYEN